MTGRPTTARLILFGSGDFAFNLYWQSVTLFLLFFLTETLRMAPATAGLVVMAATIWDGAAGLLAGMAAQRSVTQYRRWLTIGAAPLGLGFVLLYRPDAGVAAVLAANLAFRTLYAAINVPYAAWSARISRDSRDRALLSGARMVFGTVAATLVALGTPAIARASGAGDGGYLAAAMVFAAVGTPLLIAVAIATPEAIPEERASRRADLAQYFAALLRNRAFVTLNLAAIASGLAGAIAGQSVLYYFRHVVQADAAGPQTLAMMGVGGAIAIPLWTIAAARLGSRAVWLLAATAGAIVTSIFAVAGTSGAAFYLIALQVMLSGLHLAFWALLPDTVEYGEATSGVRVEALAFGVAATLQKLTLAAAAGIIGAWYSWIGYAPGPGPAAPTTMGAGIRTLMIAAPLIGLTVSALVMLANPLRRGTHAAIVARLADTPSRP